MKEESNYPDEGATRFAVDGMLEVFDGTSWTPYQPVFDDDYGVVFKGTDPPKPEANDSASAHP